MELPLNLKMMSNPINWVIIVLMVLLASIAVDRVRYYVMS